jgi:putative transcriptional regulator
MSKEKRDSPLRKRRRELDLTQEELASAIGVDATTIRNWEAGRNPPKLKVSTLKALCKTMGWRSIDDIPDYFGPSEDGE